MKFPRNAKIFKGQLDLAPLSCVFFLLIIFLLLNNSLVFVPGVRIELPSAGNRPIPGLAGPSATIAVDSAGQIFFENQVVHAPELLPRLKQLAEKHTGLTLILQADRAVRMEKLLQLSQLAHDAGIRYVWLASQVLDQPQPLLWQSVQ